MPKVMLTLHNRQSEPSIEEVMKEMHLANKDVDVDYGVQMIDPVAGEYVILVEQAIAAKLCKEHDYNVSGPYADVRIEPFGPPET